MGSGPDREDGKTGPSGKRAEKLISNFYAGALLAGVGSAIAFVSYFLDPISYVGLEVPGSAFYLVALATVLVVVGLALAGTPDEPRIGA